MPHQGELDVDGGGPQFVDSAVELLGADRVGHGICSLASPETTAMLAQQQICCEVCPTSNYQGLHLCRNHQDHHRPNLPSKTDLVQKINKFKSFTTKKQVCDFTLEISKLKNIQIIAQVDESFIVAKLEVYGQNGKNSKEESVGRCMRGVLISID